MIDSKIERSVTWSKSAHMLIPALLISMSIRPYASTVRWIRLAHCGSSPTSAGIATAEAGVLLLLSLLASAALEIVATWWSAWFGGWEGAARSASPSPSEHALHTERQSPIPRSQRRDDRVEHPNRRPGARVELRGGPTGGQPPRVVALARVDAAVDDRTLTSREPRFVGDDGRGVAVGVLDLELRQQRRLVAVDALGEALEAVLLRVPGPGQPGTDHVVAKSNSGRNVDRLVDQPVLVAGPPGCQDAVVDRLAVDLDVGRAERRIEQPCPADRPVDTETAT